MHEVKIATLSEFKIFRVDQKRQSAHAHNKDCYLVRIQ